MNNNEFPQNLPENPAALESYENLTAMIARLEESSPYAGEIRENGKIILTEKEGEKNEKFEAVRITDPDSEEARGFSEFLGRYFESNELDSPERMRSGIKSADRTAYYAILNSGREIVCGFSSSYYDLEADKEASGKKSFFAFDYIATRKDYGGKKLDRELYREALKFALQTARAKEQELTALMWFSTNRRVETLANRFTGLEFKTTCFKDAEGNIHEVQFTCPPFNPDPKTGLPIDPETKKPAEEDFEKYGVPEILMLRMIDEKNEINAEELIRMVKAYWEYNCTFKGTAGEIKASEEAVKTNREIVDGFIRTLENQISQAENGRIILLGAREKLKVKKELEAEGKKFIMSEVK